MLIADIRFLQDIVLAAVLYYSLKCIDSTLVFLLNKVNQGYCVSKLHHNISSFIGSSTKKEIFALDHNSWLYRTDIINYMQFAFVWFITCTLWVYTSCFTFVYFICYLIMRYTYNNNPNFIARPHIISSY